MVCLFAGDGSKGYQACFTNCIGAPDHEYRVKGFGETLLVKKRYFSNKEGGFQLPTTSGGRAPDLFQPRMHYPFQRLPRGIITAYKIPDSVAVGDPFAVQASVTQRGDDFHTDFLILAEQVSVFLVRRKGYRLETTPRQCIGQFLQEPGFSAAQGSGDGKGRHGRWIDEDVSDAIPQGIIWMQGGLFSPGDG